jgi:hypothetical protein
MNPQVAVSIHLNDERHELVLILGARNCSSTEFRCVTLGTCIPKEWMCDHDVSVCFYSKHLKHIVISKDDCGDGSDENAEQCRKY